MAYILFMDWNEHFEQVTALSLQKLLHCELTKNYSDLRNQ